VQHGSDVPKLPELRIVVNGTLLMEHFVVCLDGPSRNDAAFDKAFERRKRCFRPQQSDTKPPVYGRHVGSWDSLPEPTFDDGPP